MPSPVFSWPLLIPAYQQPGNVPAILQPAAGTDGPNPRYMTEADLLALLDRVYPDWYLEPLKDPGPGYEIYQAYAKTLERVSLALGRFENSNLIMFSHGGAFSVASVEFYRQSAEKGAFTVLKGTVCRTSKTNRSYLVMANVSFGAADLIVPAQVQAISYGPEYDVAGPVFTADNTLLPGEIDTVVIPFLDPVFAEPTIQVRQISDAVGGQHPVLDQHGLDRRLPRLPLETDGTYKGRIRQLPDTISPAALKRQLDAVFLPLGLSYQLIETWQNEYQSCWDAPEETIIHPMMGELELDTFAYDDPRTDPFRGRWMDERDCPAGIVVVVPDVTSWSMRGWAYDDTTVDITLTLGDELEVTLTDGTPGCLFEIVNSGPGVAGSLVLDIPGHVIVSFNNTPMDFTPDTSWEALLGYINSSTNVRGRLINATGTFSPLLYAFSGNLDPVQPEFTTALGRRGTSAYDAPDVDTDEILIPFYDGDDLLKNLFYQRVWDLLKQIKGGGLYVAIELEGQ